MIVIAAMLAASQTTLPPFTAPVPHMLYRASWTAPARASGRMLDLERTVRGLPSIRTRATLLGGPSGL